MLTAILWSCAAISIAVFGVMLYSVATFRRGDERIAAHRHAVVEVIWAAIPIAILVLAAAPAVRDVVAAPAGGSRFADRGSSEASWSDDAAAPLSNR